MAASVQANQNTGTSQEMPASGFFSLRATHILLINIPDFGMDSGPRRPAWPWRAEYREFATLGRSGAHAKASDPMCHATLLRCRTTPITATAGKIADFLVFDADPLADIRNTTRS